MVVAVANKLLERVKKQEVQNNRFFPSALALRRANQPPVIQPLIPKQLLDDEAEKPSHGPAKK